MEYLLGKNKPEKKAAHIWENEDTVCRMWSTGGLVGDYLVVNKLRGQKICKNCERVKDKKELDNAFNNSIVKEVSR